MTDRNKFQITLKAARVNAGLTQEELAKTLGISVNTLIQWEKRPSQISALRQRDISNAVNMPIDNIIFLP